MLSIRGLLIAITIAVFCAFSLPVYALNVGDPCTTPTSCMAPGLTCNQATKRCMKRFGLGMPAGFRWEKRIRDIFGRT